LLQKRFVRIETAAAERSCNTKGGGAVEDCRPHLRQISQAGNDLQTNDALPRLVQDEFLFFRWIRVGVRYQGIQRFELLNEPARTSCTLGFTTAVHGAVLTIEDLRILCQPGPVLLKSGKLCP
jgi:hypothetical protein